MAENIRERMFNFQTMVAVLSVDLIALTEEVERLRKDNESLREEVQRSHLFIQKGIYGA